MVYCLTQEVTMRYLQEHRQRRLLFTEEADGVRLPNEVQESCRQLLAQMLIRVTHLEPKEGRRNERQDPTGPP